MKVIKRDGREVDFDKSKISNAIIKAMREVYPTFIKCDAEIIDYANETAFSIESMFSMEKIISVEKIQDIIESFLMKSEYEEAAKAYIKYRYLHKMARDRYKDLMDAVSKKLAAKDVQNQNANVDEYSFGGRIGEATDIVTKRFAIENLLSPMAKANHEGNMIYEHDLNAFAVGSHNCMTIPYDDLLANGFNTRQTDVRPAQSICTAFQLVAVIFQLQSLQQFGGVSASHLDWTMVPYVRKSFYKHFKDGVVYIEDLDLSDFDNGYITDTLPIESNEYKSYPKAFKYAMDMTVKETYQAVEGMYHNLNTLQSRSGNQLPFTSINYGTCILPEGRMITKALLDVSIKGIGKLHRTSIFPCGIFQMMTGVNRKQGDPNYDLFQLALRSTSQRLYPNYANVDWSGNAGYDPNDPKTFFSTINKNCGLGQ